jgi:hypothetical protein
MGQISDHSLHYQRYLNWAEALRSHHIDIDERLAQDDNGSREGAYHVTRALLQLDTPPSAAISTCVESVERRWQVHYEATRESCAHTAGTSLTEAYFRSQ